MGKFEITWLEDTSDEAVLEEIRRVATLAPGRRLTRAEFDSHSRISSAKVERRFGSWSEATRRAGLTDALPVYTNTAIIEDLQRVSELSQSGPFTVAIYTHCGGKYSHSKIKRLFGGWQEALAAAGIASRYAGPSITDRMRSQPGRNISNEGILSRISNIYAQSGKNAISGNDIVDADPILTQNMLNRRFGGVSAALRQTGAPQINHGRRYTEDEVFENLLKVWTYYGRTPTAHDMGLSPSTVGLNTYIKRWGGWRNALRAFVERANSEDDAEPVSAPEQVQVTPAKISDQEGTSQDDVVCTSGVIVESRNVTSPPVKRSARTYTRPDDRRDPGMGLRFKVLQRDLFRCKQCGRSPATDLNCRLHVDHIVAFANGGKTTIENLQALCAECNIGKSDKEI